MHVQLKEVNHHETGTRNKFERTMKALHNLKQYETVLLHLHKQTKQCHFMQSEKVQHSLDIPSHYYYCRYGAVHTVSNPSIRSIQYL